MANPTPYVPSYSFSGWQASNPSKPLPADQVDNEYANISLSLGQTIDALADVRRSDGTIQNGIVTVDSLSPGISPGFVLRGQWAAGQHYIAADSVVYNGLFYRANATHDSTNANRPDLSPSTWTFLFSTTALAGAMPIVTYDPTGIGADVFNRVNHYGTQAISTVSGLQTALDARLALAGGTMTGGLNLGGNLLSNFTSPLLKGYISPGANLANGSDTTNDIDFPAMVVASEAAAPILMDHPAATGVNGVQLDVAYGTGNGGRFASAISDGTWNCFVISNGTTVSRGFSKLLNPTTEPNYPAGYTHYRRVGFAVRVSGVIRQFVMDGDDVWWKDNSGQDFSVTNPGTAGVLRTIGAPTGVSVVAMFNFRMTFADSSNTTSAYVSSPMVNDDPASGNTPNAVSAGALAGALVMSTAFSQLRVLTDTSARVRIRNNVSNANLGISGLCVGYRDTRGRL